jgi:hypothetical protein
MTAGRANMLALKEVNRRVTVREGDKVLTLPAIQAVLRSMVAVAAKGNGPVQRFLVEVIQAIERPIHRFPIWSALPRGGCPNWRSTSSRCPGRPCARA